VSLLFEITLFKNQNHIHEVRSRSLKNMDFIYYQDVFKK